MANHIYQRLKNFNIKEKFVLYFIPFTLFSVIISGIVVYYYSKDAVLSRTFEQLTSVRVLKTRQLESYFDETIEKIKLIESLIRTNKADVIQLNDPILKNIEQRLDKSIKSKIKSIKLLTISDTAIPKNIVDSIKSHREKQTQLTEYYLSDYQVSSLQGNIEMFVYSTFGENHELVLAYSVSIDKINEIMLEKDPANGLGASGESYIIGQDKKFRSNSRFIPKSIFKDTIVSDRSTVQFELQPTNIITKDYRNIDVLSSFSKIDINGLNWAIVAEIDYSEAIAPANAILAKIILSAIFIAILSLFIVFVIVNKITKPLLELTSLAEDISHGKKARFLNNSSTDEIGKLTQAFNNMNREIVNRRRQLNKEKLIRYAHIIDAQEKERITLARDLHDGIGQIFIALKLRLESLNNSPEDAPIVENIKDTLNLAIDEIRNFSYSLEPPTLREFGLISALETMIQNISSISGIQIIFVNKLVKSINKDKTSIYIFRIVQELLNNIVKHSKASIAHIIISEKQGKFCIFVKDNGKGFNVRQNFSGNGLYGIKERVSVLRGKINIKSSERGTYFKILLPINQKIEQ